MHHRLSFVRIALVSLAFALAGCGDDTVNPTNPDAGPTKDATTEGGEGGAHEGGGDSAAKDVAPTEDAAEEASTTDGGAGGGDGAAEAGEALDGALEADVASE